MKISLKWLQDYVDVAEYMQKPQELAALLTGAGIEVEGIENLSKQFENVVVGHILERGQHPNADRLTLCQISVGDGKVMQIVCGATNHKTGDRIVVALPGAVLPGDFVIKVSKIRNVESYGMLCSDKELGLSEESQGIRILPADAPVGKPFAEYMGFDDILFELKVTPNRADCLSHFGLAREIGCLLGKPAQFPIESFQEEAEGTQAQVELLVKTPDLCPRYGGRGVRGVKVGPSPDWMKKRLEAVGINSINNIVDITNYVMLELGQPLHAFDVRELKGGKVVVDLARAGEKFTTLDGTEIALSAEDLTIRDAERVVALAGVVGGKNSGIQDDTSEVFIECAYFTATGVRRTSRKHGIDTDSAYRFSRGVNPEAIQLAMNRAAQLMQKHAGGKVLGEAYDFYPDPVKKQPIEITHETLVSRLGYNVEPSKFEEWMKRLGCEVKAKGDAWTVLAPLFRWDLTMDMDLVEEFARLHGYQHIPETLPALHMEPTDHDAVFLHEGKLRRLLQGENYNQAINYAFVSKSFQEKILGDVEKVKKTGLTISPNAVGIVNPLNEEINVMRTSLIPWLVKNVVHNVNHGNYFGRLFEIGHVHVPMNQDGAASYKQENHLAFALWGAPQGLWQKQPLSPLVFELKAAVENILRSLQINKWKWSTSTKDAPEFLHPGQWATLFMEGKNVGFIGALHPTLQEEFKTRGEVAVAELNLEKVLQGQPRAPKFKSISKFPAVDRDIAFLMPKELVAADIEEQIRKTAGELLQDVRAFDVFEGGSLPAGQKSVAFRLLFQDLNATLEDARVNELREKVVDAVCQKFSISRR